jgi:light-regulated signal transduction histidine kinase (bacteriophytochrome)
MAVQPEIKDTSLHQYDSEFCGSIPLHLINLIQPHGALLVLSKDTLVVAQVSENVTDLLAAAPEGLLGRPLADFLPGAQLEELREKIDRWGIRDRIPMDLALTTARGQVHCMASVHPKSSYVLLELEPLATDAEASFTRPTRRSSTSRRPSRRAPTPRPSARLPPSKSSSFPASTG